MSLVIAPGPIGHDRPDAPTSIVGHESVGKGLRPALVAVV